MFFWSVGSLATLPPGWQAPVIRLPIFPPKSSQPLAPVAGGHCSEVAQAQIKMHSMEIAKMNSICYLRPCAISLILISLIALLRDSMEISM